MRKLLTCYPFSYTISVKQPYSKESSGHNFKNKAIEATLELVKEIKPSILQILQILPILCL